jgi:phosphatidylserine/phosphatidylglycerophosphate/cardiolipin synthase-like enzyme
VNWVRVTGAFNFSQQAKASNAENLLVIRDKVVAGRYDDDWQGHVEHSEVYAGREMAYRLQNDITADRNCLPYSFSTICMML